MGRGRYNLGGALSGLGTGLQSLAAMLYAEHQRAQERADRDRERAADRDWQQRMWKLQRQAAAEERASQQGFTAGENALGRSAQAAQQQRGQDFTSMQNRIALRERGIESYGQLLNPEYTLNPDMYREQLNAYEFPRNPAVTQAVSAALGAIPGNVGGSQVGAALAAAARQQTPLHPAARIAQEAAQIPITEQRPRSLAGGMALSNPSASVFGAVTRGPGGGSSRSWGERIMDEYRKQKRTNPETNANDLLVNALNAVNPPAAERTRFTSSVRVAPGATLEEKIAYVIEGREVPLPQPAPADSSPSPQPTARPRAPRLPD